MALPQPRAAGNPKRLAPREKLRPWDVLPGPWCDAAALAALRLGGIACTSVPVGNAKGHRSV